MRSGQDDERATDRRRAAGGVPDGATGGVPGGARGGLARRGADGGTAGQAPASPTAGDDAATAGAARAGGGASGTAPGRRAERSAVGWVGLLVAAVLTVWQIVFAVSHQGLEPDDQDTYAAVSLFVTLVLSVGAVVLGLVALSQRRGPRWPAIVALAVGAQVFLVTVATWVGDLASGGAA